MERVNKVVSREALVHPRCGRVQRDLGRFNKKEIFVQENLQFPGPGLYVNDGSFRSLHLKEDQGSIRGLYV